MDDPGARSARLRALPQLQRLLELAPELAADASHAEAVAVLREALDAARDRLLADPHAPPPTPDSLIAAAQARLAVRRQPVLRRVINATGVVLHTNLGRAPLPAPALRAMAEASQGYCNLEFDLERGQRGSRTAGVEPLLRELTGAEAGLAVNNAAAAVLLALSALAGPQAGEAGEVIVSRGELVEIGGGFRIPEVIAQGGARLVEVGATNRTRIADYAAAITPQTRVLLKVHQSNYRIVGFTAEASLEELAELARAKGLILMHDLGGGALIDLRRLGRPREPTVADSLTAGADLVAFSGDKLLGGPQAGILAGRSEAIAPLRRHPLLRAVRLDKTALAALEATLRLYRDPARAVAEIPVLTMLAQPLDGIRVRAERLADLLAAPGREPKVTATTAYAGGGALPGEGVDSFAVRLDGSAPDALSARLRVGAPPVVARIADDALWLDLLTVTDDEVAVLARAVIAALKG